MDPTQLECLVNFVMKGDSSYHNQIVPMNNSNRSPVETCYGILKHCFPTTKYHLPEKDFIPNEDMSNDKIKEAINTSVKKIHFQNTFSIAVALYLKNETTGTKNVFWKIKRILHLSLKKNRKRNSSGVNKVSYTIDKERTTALFNLCRNTYPSFTYEYQ